MVYFQPPHLTIYNGDALEVLKTVPAKSVHCVVTSPPYWGLRDYGIEGQIGLEATVQEHIEKLIQVFREVRRVLRNDGVCWVNYGDAYAGSNNGMNADGTKGVYNGRQLSNKGSMNGVPIIKSHLPKGNIIGLPWRFAFAMQDDGWILRQDIVWHKPNPMPESVKDRCTKSHEYIFMFTKKAKYYFEQLTELRSSMDDRPRWVHMEQQAQIQGLEIPHLLWEVTERLRVTPADVIRATEKPFAAAVLILEGKALKIVQTMTTHLSATALQIVFIVTNILSGLHRFRAASRLPFLPNTTPLSLQH